VTIKYSYYYNKVNNKLKYRKYMLDYRCRNTYLTKKLITSTKYFKVTEHNNKDTCLNYK